MIPNNPAASVKGPKYTTKKGKPPILTPEETRLLLNKIAVSHVVGLRDRALIGAMVFSLRGCQQSVFTLPAPFD